MICTGKYGNIIKTELYGGKTHESANAELLKSSKVVWDLAKVLPDGKNFKLAFDNWFSSELFSMLSSRGIFCISTFQLTRFKGLSYIEDKQMKTTGRGTFIEKQGIWKNTTISAVKWYENRPVYIASNYIIASPPTIVKRWSSDEHQEIDVTCPALIPEYNSFMGQIDNTGRLLSLYRIKIDSRRFYLKIFYHFADLAVINSWLLYRRDTEALGLVKTMDLWDFEASIAFELCTTAKDRLGRKRKVGRPRYSEVEHEHLMKKMRGPAKPLPTKERRTDGLSHWPKFFEKRGRCKNPICSKILVQLEPRSWAMKNAMSICVSQPTRTVSSSFMKNDLKFVDFPCFLESLH